MNNLKNDFSVGDIVLVYKGRKTCFYEIIKLEDKVAWIADGWVQIKKEYNEMDLICKAENRHDNSVPFLKYVN